ncbi:MAG: hypothetical protein LUE91_03150 [Oscillospiraceae bacterium]|nr:hypothetical protein [Oscillospiraceae bacterium]
MLTTTYALSVLNCILGHRNYTTTFHSGNIYIGLSTTAPAYDGSNFTEPTCCTPYTVTASDGTETEITSSSYARVPISLGTASSGAVTTTLSYLSSAVYHDGSTANDGDTDDYWWIYNSTEIKFPEASTDWIDTDGNSTLGYFGLFSSASGGTPFFVGELTSSITVSGTDSEGKIAIIRAGELIIKINAD